MLHLDTIAPLKAQPQRPQATQSVYRADSEYGRLQSVLVADPGHLELVDCNAVSNASLEAGCAVDLRRAQRQHRSLVYALECEGVEVNILDARPDLPDLAFTRDTSLMTPWGLLGLSPGAAHRRKEVDIVLDYARAGGIPVMGRIREGRIEGGDIAMLRPGLLAIGISGVRTDEAGASAVADVYERHGWDVLRYRFDPRHLHLDTQFCMVDRGVAIACTDVLDAAFVAHVESLGIEIVVAAVEDVGQLGCNILSLGDHRIVSAGTCPNIDAALAQRGFHVIAADLDQFTMCGGGVHCLTMPLSRLPG